ncbi:glycosyltransferase family 39 protein [Curvibacter sp. HBC61]|uniref:Glycosyltransferase family 39 protein n=1 Tax=Curvibacter cyanobacteriorum TaxID=3026422 RepID=A0ABT5N3L3_9BURK|nr:glycosyltransferase family 39 protein [Curvibacter sp. HBC61]MDD0840628.1 glycosyltransferase family 39 protein [Curvibacter sp. HBC61]
MTERQKSWATLALLWALLLLLSALRPMAVPDEGRYGEIGRWMLQSGDWLVPRLNGIPFFHKPPLLHWVNASLMALLGAHVWVARLGPALHAGAMLLALYLSVRAMPWDTGARAEGLARRAALMLGSSLAFLIGGQYINHDMLVACWIGIAIWAFAAAFVGADDGGRAGRGPWVPRPGLARLGFVACGLGVLSKGLIGLVLPGLVLLVWLLWTRQMRKVLYLPWLRGLLLFGLIAVPWFVLAERRAPGLLAYLFGDQQFNRYTANTFNNGRPWWFYLAGLFLLLFPWTFFALQPLVARLRRRPGAAGLALSPGQRVWVALAWIWLVAIIGFFSVPHSKLIGYALPVMPALAFLAALGFEQGLGGWRHAERLFKGLLVLAVGVALAVNLAATRYTERHGTADVAAVLACQIGPGDTVLAVGDFPYDLPFLVRLPQPMVVVQDWARERQSARDNWRRELFEGAAFDARAGERLQDPEVLERAAQQPGQWVIAPNNVAIRDFESVSRGLAWTLYRSAPTQPVSPAPAHCKR